jgi:hypothetical protein
MRTLIIAFAGAICTLTSFAQETIPLEQLLSPAEQQKIGIQKLSATERESLRLILLSKMTEAYRLGQTRAVQPAAAPQQGGQAQPVRPRGGLYAGVGGGHWVKENIERGSMFILEDGSLWQVDRLERLDASLWLKITNISVVEATDGALGYDYLLINTDDDEKVHAKYLGKK